MTPNLLDELEKVFSPNVDYSTAALRAFNFCRTHAPALADMAKRLEAAERDGKRLDWLETDAISIMLDGREHAETAIGTDRGSIDAAIDATQEGEG